MVSFPYHKEFLTPEERDDEYARLRAKYQDRHMKKYSTTKYGLLIGNKK